MSKHRNRNMCVKIARDVLKQLRLERYIATQGTYVELCNVNHNEDCDKSFKEVFKENKQISCDVCALGSTFVSLVNIENKCTVYEMLDHEDMFNRLAKYFGGENMALIESAFECHVMDAMDAFEWEQDTLELAAEWGQRYDNPTKRLRAIMINIIRNNGDFKLPVKMLARAKSLAEGLDAGNDSW